MDIYESISYMLLQIVVKSVMAFDKHILQLEPHSMLQTTSLKAHVKDTVEKFHPVRAHSAPTAQFCTCGKLVKLGENLKIYDELAVTVPN